MWEKRKLTRKSLDELAKIMPVLSEEEQRVCIGGSGGFTLAQDDKGNYWLSAAIPVAMAAASVDGPFFVGDVLGLGLLCIAGAHDKYVKFSEKDINSIDVNQLKTVYYNTASTIENSPILPNSPDPGPGKRWIPGVAAIGEMLRSLFGTYGADIARPDTLPLSYLKPSYRIDSSGNLIPYRPSEPIGSGTTNP